MLPNRTQIDRDTAIAMAVYTGNLLHRQRDDMHLWAITLIISNLFELLGEGQSSEDRFVNGYATIVGRGHDEKVVLGWHAGCIARAIRNLVVHGLALDRSQLKNYDSRERVTVESVGFIPASATETDNVLFDVDRVQDRALQAAILANDLLVIRTGMVRQRRF